MIRVVILGFGNLGYHLSKALNKSDKVSVNQIYNRNNTVLPKDLNSIPFTTSLSDLEEADAYIMAVTDDAITTLSEDLKIRDKLVIHTSGGVSIDAISNNNRKGVLYPLQTFSKSRKAKFKKIPVCIEATSINDSDILRSIGGAISKKVVEINSEERKKLHLAAVFVNNFVNHMYSIGESILDQYDLPFELIQPLILETAQKIGSLSPLDAQTGPARRDDTKTIQKHLHLLEDSPYKDLYKKLTESIQSTYGKKL